MSTNGTIVDTFNISNGSSISHFAVASDGNGGILVTDPASDPHGHSAKLAGAARLTAQEGKIAEDKTLIADEFKLGVENIISPRVLIDARMSFIGSDRLSGQSISTDYAIDRDHFSTSAESLTERAPVNLQNLSGISALDGFDAKYASAKIFSQAADDTTFIRNSSFDTTGQSNLRAPEIPSVSNSYGGQLLPRDPSLSWSSNVHLSSHGLGS